MSLNAPAWKAIGEPDAVELLWNAPKRLVGIRPADPGLEHVYKLRRQERTTTSTHVLSFIAFAQRYGIAIRTGTSRRYDVEVRDGVLILDLNKKPVEVIGPRAKNPRTAQ
jgi:hypothetical protein